MGQIPKVSKIYQEKQLIYNYQTTIHSWQRVDYEVNTQQIYLSSYVLPSLTLLNSLV
jgi:hypothetical protein